MTSEYPLKMIVSKITRVKGGSELEFRKDNGPLADDILWLNSHQITDLDIGDEVEVTITSEWRNK